MVNDRQYKDAAQALAELTQTNSELRAKVQELEAELRKRRKGLRRAASVSELLQRRYDTLRLSDEWRAAFGEPERKGVWFIWGRSGSGKTSFVLQLCKELAGHGRVLYDSLEEGTCLTMRNALVRVGMADVSRRFVLVSESVDELSLRLKRHKSPEVAVIDSFQYAELTYKRFHDFVSEHRNKLLVFVSQCEGNNPTGRGARSALFDADLKIWVEGYRAFSKGRTFGERGYYTVWQERAEKYWGERKL